MINELKDKGFVHLANQTGQDLNRILQMFGDVLLTTDITVRADSKGMVTTVLGLDYHTDHHKARYILWYCHRQTDNGGESILLDAEKVYSNLSKEIQDELTKINLFEHKVFEDDKDHYPLVAFDQNGRIRFYYSFWLVKDEDRNNLALKEFQNRMKEAESFEIKLKEKDILIVDNHRMFHGRKPIEGSKDRFLKRYWLQGNK